MKKKVTQQASQEEEMRMLNLKTQRFKEIMKKYNEEKEEKECLEEQLDEIKNTLN